MVFRAFDLCNSLSVTAILWLETQNQSMLFTALSALEMHSAGCLDNDFTPSVLADKYAVRSDLAKCVTV